MYFKVTLWTLGILPWMFLIVPFVLTATKRGKEGIRWRIRIAMGWDQLVNTFFNGSEDETISSRVGRGAAAGKFRYRILGAAIDMLFYLITGQKNHCRDAIGF